MSDVGDFRYVEFASRVLPGFRNNVVSVEKLPMLVRNYGYSECFSSCFMFDERFNNYVKDNCGSVSGYQGPCYSYFLPLDIDNYDLHKSLETTREIVDYFIRLFDAPEEAITLYFSGNKGFHLMLASRLFGDVEPGEELPRVYQELRKEIVREAGLSNPDSVDFSISDRMRLLRLPNTRHGRSGLYKIPLKLEELLFCEPGAIRNLARRPRQLLLTDESGLLPKGNVEPNPALVEMYGICKEKMLNRTCKDLPNPGTFLDNGDISKAFCEAELGLYREGVPEGFRSSVCLRLASRMRSAGYREEEALRMIENFSERCEPKLNPSIAVGVVKSAYRVEGNGYQFGCGSGEGDPAHTRLVYERCPYRARRAECEKYRRFYTQLTDGKNEIR